MTDKLEAQIDAALAAEERELLNQIGKEPGFYSQVFSTFGGRLGWVNLILMLVQSVMFVGGAWAAWRFFQAADPLEALRWGLPAAVALLVALIIKLTMWPAIQTNRVIREIRRLELIAARR